MPVQKKRVYNSPARGTQAAQTKDRILARARELFQADGFDQVTIEKIARAAQVSGPTVYAIFKSKRGILRVLMDTALPVDQLEALVEQANHAQSARELFTIAAKIARHMYDAEHAQTNVFQGAAVLAPEFEKLEKERELRRYKRQEATFKKLVHKELVITGLSLAKARDILWAFTGRDLYRMLVVEQGWSSDEYEKWLAQCLIMTILKS